MTIPKKYLHDHLVLLLLSANAFLTVLDSLFLLVRLSSTHRNGYIVQCRDCANVNAVNKFSTGSIVDLLGFLVFAWLVMAVHTLLSLRVYRIHRQLAIAMLSLGTLLLTLTFIVSYALLTYAN